MSFGSNADINNSKKKPLEDPTGRVDRGTSAADEANLNQEQYQEFVLANEEPMECSSMQCSSVSAAAGDSIVESPARAATSKADGVLPICIIEQQVRRAASQQPGSSDAAPTLLLAEVFERQQQQGVDAEVLAALIAAIVAIIVLVLLFVLGGDV